MRCGGVQRPARRRARTKVPAAQSPDSSLSATQVELLYAALGLPGHAIKISPINTYEDHNNVLRNRNGTGSTLVTSDVSYDTIKYIEEKSEAGIIQYQFGCALFEQSREVLGLVQEYLIRRLLQNVLYILLSNATRQMLRCRSPRN